MNAFLKVSIAASSIAMSLNAHAGLFDKTDKLSCDSPESNKALSAYLRDSVTSTLQTDYFTSRSLFNEKPIQLFIDKMNSIPININNVRLYSQYSDAQVECVANISIDIPRETLDVLNKIAVPIEEVKGDGYFLNGKIGWESYHYKLVLSDNKSDISVTDLNGKAIVPSLKAVAMIAVNYDDIIMGYKRDKLDGAIEGYNVLDTDLNLIWNHFPDKVRKIMKDSQVKWVNEKINKCGKISDARSNTTNIDDRINIFECHANMTSDRIEFFDPDYFKP